VLNESHAWYALVPGTGSQAGGGGGGASDDADAAAAGWCRDDPASSLPAVRARRDDALSVARVPGTTVMASVSSVSARTGSK